jgi:predicted nucleotidyltransferase
MKSKERSIPNLIGLNIRETDPFAQVILFGSRARGEAKKESDWDILVLTDYPVNPEKEKIFRDHLYLLELEVEEPFSVFVYSKQDWENRQKITPFYHNVNKDGIRI